MVAKSPVDEADAVERKPDTVMPTVSLDFSKYRRPELAEQISGLVSLPRSLATIARVAGVTLLATVLVVSALFWGQVHVSLLVAVVVYASFAALLVGTLLGCLVAINGALGNLLRIFDLGLEITRHALDDVASLRHGSTRIPSVRQTVRGVYEHVLLPTVEGVVVGQSRVLGRLVFRFYRWTLGRLLETLLDKMDDRIEAGDVVIAASAANAANSLKENIDQRLGSVATTTQSAADWLARAHERVSSTGNGLRRLVIIPLGLVLSLIIFVATVPLVIVWFAN